VKQPFPKSLKYAINGVLGLICLQFALGVSTIIYQVPLVIASLHQVIAFILFAAMLYCAYKIRSTY
jgi:cytochrome c oxidase assembly protein subunit 15